MGKETKKLSSDSSVMLKEIYGTEEEGQYAQDLIQTINDDLEVREKASTIANGLTYSKGYEYNQEKAINYAPPRDEEDDRQISMGLPHEKIISLAAIFLKYVFKRDVKCYDNNGTLVKGMGRIYDLSIEHSYKLENLKKKLASIYWETFSQGDCFVLEDWEVKVVNVPKAYNKKKGKDKVLVTPDNMDFTHEFLDGLTYEKGKDFQTRRAVSRVLDGRQVIFGNPEIDDVQGQPRLAIETEYTKAEAEALFGTLNRWKHVPTEETRIDNVVGEKTTLYDVNRFKDKDDVYISHLVLDTEKNRYNIFVNGVMMLPSATPMTIFHPRNNYPLSRVPAERVKDSIYSRGTVAKTKFDSDYLDWLIKSLSNKLEQGIAPAILSHGKYTLSRDMFKANQVTHGVRSDDYEKADPDNKGVTSSEFSFVGLMKEIIESKTVNPTTSGEISESTATAVTAAQTNQAIKLGYLLDGLVFGFMDMALRRAETIESKYTIKQKETMVDGKKIPVYQNFTINVAGVENVVAFDDTVGTEGYDEEGKKAELFKKMFDAEKKGEKTQWHLVNPTTLRQCKLHVDIDIKPEKIKDTQLEMIQMWDEFSKLLQTFGNTVDTKVLQKEYLDVSGRPDELFTSEMYKKLEEEDGGAGYNMGNYGKPQQPTIKGAQQKDAGLK